MEAIKDASHLYEVERRAEHAARPGFRITEPELSAKLLAASSLILWFAVIILGRYIQYYQDSIPFGQ